MPGSIGSRYTKLTHPNGHAIWVNAADPPTIVTISEHPDYSGNTMLIWSSESFHTVTEPIDVVFRKLGAGVVVEP